ncbi:MAG TPA: glutathione S-transferase family protein [Sphingomonas sp.]|nr:glutathione S-transferase family protein [Sphingomonas sp.]
MAEFVIHGVPGSPYVRAPLVALEEKGAAWKLAALPFGGHKAPEYRAIHPFQKIPAMDHGDFRLYETTAMLRYIDNAIDGPALVPADPKLAARMDQVMSVTLCYVTPTVSATLSFHRMVAPVLGLPVDEQAIASGIGPARDTLAEVARLLGSQPFMAGEQVSLADCMLASHISFLREYDEGRMLLAELPGLSAWIERMEARPSMTATTWDRLREMTGQKLAA